MSLKHHPFWRENNDRTSQYFAALHGSVAAIAGRTHSPDAIAQRILEKLQVAAESKADLNQFLQYASEATVVSLLARCPQGTFTCEEPASGRKNIDGCLVLNGFNFRIEVKCPNPKKLDGPVIESTTILRTYGRVNSLPTLRKDVNSMLEALDMPQVVGLPNSDLKIKDCLDHAAQKFGDDTSCDKINCVAICGDDSDAMQHFYHCLYGSQGLFTESSFAAGSDYSSVDAVLLTNVRHRHAQYYERPLIGNPWLLEEAFSVVLANPLRRVRKDRGLRALATLIPNFGKQVREYPVPGDAPVDVIDAIKIRYFIEHELPKTNPNCF